jgi:prepilin-type N-terminal cleavage/methylation domain-containing protein
MRLFKNNAGFTLIELLVVVAIMGIISAMGVVGFRSNQKTTALNSDTLVFLDYFYQAQTQALAGGKPMVADSGSIVGEFRPTSYGIVIADSFDFDGESGYTGCKSGCYYAGYQGLFFRLEDIVLGDSITINSDSFDSVVTSFSLPRARMTILVDEVPTSSVSLELNNDSLQKCIDIGAVSGRMDIINC